MNVEGENALAQTHNDKNLIVMMCNNTILLRRFMIQFKYKRRYPPE